MSNNFDEFPLYDPLIKKGSMNMNDIWISAMSTFYQNLISYLSSSGIFLPMLTATQISALQNPQSGQMIYNITTNAPQIYQNGVWKTFVTA